MDYKIECLLLLKYKEEYAKFKDDLNISNNSSSNKSDIFHSNIGSGKIKNKNVNYERLKCFEKLHYKQLKDIEDLFM
jgi:hypothetical protein